MTDQEKLDLVPILQAEIRKLRARVDEIEKVVGPGHIELRDASGYYLRLQATPHGSGVWASKGDGDAAHGPTAALFAGFGTEGGTVGVCRRHDPNRPVAGMDAALTADTPNGGFVRVVSASGSAAALTGEGPA